jgi:DNA-nicking Smr family endonuclease
MKPPRGLSPDEAALWARLAHTVIPLAGRRMPPLPKVPAPDSAKPPPARKRTALPESPSPPPVARHARSLVLREDRGLDSHWERKLSKAAIAPDYTLDLHGHTLDSAHARLDHGLAQARAMGARMVLLVTGKPRPADAADRGERRGAIRAKILDWLAAGPHGDAIAAIRPAHPRHGGAGALYLVLKRPR